MVENLRPWPADQVERRPLAAIIPYPNNARIHSDEQVEKIAASMLHWGVTAPVLVDEEGVLIYGHGRRRAAELLVSRGRAQFATLPCSIARGWLEDDKRAYRLADNQLTELSEWDWPLLKGEAALLRASGFETSLLGFAQADWTRILANPGGLDPDAPAPTVPTQPVTRTGDLWHMGEHRLLCGDATAGDDVVALMGSARARLMATDPPYGVNYSDVQDSRVRAGRASQAIPIINDDLDGLHLQRFLERALRAALPILDRPAVYLWCAPLSNGWRSFAAAQSCGLHISRQVIWVKPSLILGRGDYHWRHEVCWYGWVEGQPHTWRAGRDQTTVWEIGREYDGEHPTQKPVDLFRRPIENHVESGEIVYEPFAGSGTQVIAAELTARRCYAMEIVPGYCDVVVQRWQAISGREAMLASGGDGRTFEEVAAERAKESAPEGALLEEASEDQIAI